MSVYLISVPMSVYGLTLIQQKLCEPMLNHYDLVNGYLATPQNAPDRADWREHDYYKKYTDWCEKQGKSVGHAPPPLSKSQWAFIGTSCIVIQSLKHLIGCVESIVRIPFSILTHLTEYAMKAPLICRAISIQTTKKLESFNNHLGTPLSNLGHAIGEVSLTVIMGFASLIKAGYFFPSEDKYKQLYDNFEHEIKTATGDQLWQCYALADNPNIRQKY